MSIDFYILCIGIIALRDADFIIMTTLMSFNNICRVALVPS